MRRETYKREIGLQDNEIPARKDLETGKYTDMPGRKNNIPKGKELMGIKEVGWRKSFDHSWDFLEEVLTDLELRVVMRLCRVAEISTNSLEPLNDDTAQRELSDIFNIDHRKSKKMFEKFFVLGIYGRFEVFNPSVPYTKFWVLNPYLSFAGKTVDSDIKNLFKGTTLTKEYLKRASQKTK